MTPIHIYDSEFFSASWMDYPHECKYESAAHRGSVKSSLNCEEMVGRNLPALCGSHRKLRSLCLFQNTDFIFLLSNCLSRKVATGNMVAWLLNAPDTDTIKPCSSSSLCCYFQTRMSYYSSHPLQTAGKFQETVETGLEEHIQMWPSQLLWPQRSWVKIRWGGWEMHRIS